jgi:hypothetical protein
MVATCLYIAASIWFETTQTEQALTFPRVTAPVRRLVVPAGEDDPNFREAQESINSCQKHVQNNLSLKKSALPEA